MNKKEHLPMMGVGPIYGIGIIACTVAGIVASKEGWLPAVRIEGLRVPFLILGILLIVLGISIWSIADESIAVFHGNGAILRKGSKQ